MSTDHQRIQCCQARSARCCRQRAIAIGAWQLRGRMPHAPLAEAGNARQWQASNTRCGTHVADNMQCQGHCCSSALLPHDDYRHTSARHQALLCARRAGACFIITSPRRIKEWGSVPRTWLPGQAGSWRAKTWVGCDVGAQPRRGGGCVAGQTQDLSDGLTRRHWHSKDIAEFVGKGGERNTCNA